MSTAMMMENAENMRQEPTINSALPERGVVGKSANTQQLGAGDGTNTMT